MKDKGIKLSNKFLENEESKIAFWVFKPNYSQIPKY